LKAKHLNALLRRILDHLHLMVNIRLSISSIGESVGAALCACINPHLIILDIVSKSLAHPIYTRFRVPFCCCFFNFVQNSIELGPVISFAPKRDSFQPPNENGSRGTGRLC
jgi:hypothetical protein